MRLSPEDDEVVVMAGGELEDAFSGIAGDDAALRVGVVEALVKAAAELVHGGSMRGILRGADVEDVEPGMPLADSGEDKGHCGEGLRGKVRGEEDTLELEVGTRAGRTRSDGEDRTEDEMEDLLGDGAEEKTGKAASSVGAKDEEVDVVVADEGAGHLSDFALLHPAPTVDAVEAVLALEAAEQVVTVAVGHLGEGGQHIRRIGELRRTQEVEEVEGGAEVARHGHAMLDGMLGAGREVGGHGDIMDGNFGNGVGHHDPSLPFAAPGTSGPGAGGLS